MDIQGDYAENTSPEIDKRVAGFVHQHFGDTSKQYLRVHSNIWRFQEENFEYNLIITSKLVIFDSLLFPFLPEKQNEFMRELLELNAHQTKQAKFCIVKDGIHLRLINEHAHYTYEEFQDNILEYRWQLPRMRDNLGAKYFVQKKEEE